MSSEPVIAQLLADAGLHADRLARRYNLQPADRDDAFQEIALDAWRRLTRYQASRGDLEVFLGMVTLNQARKIEMRFCRRRDRPEVSLGTPIVGNGDDGELTLEDSLTQDDGFDALLGNLVNGHGRVELLLDVTRTIARLPSEMQELCACLAHETPGLARRACSMSNAGMYRRIEELRLHFSAFGLGTS